MSSSSAVGLLIGKIVSALENEVLLIGGVRNEIVQLRQELESMRSFLQDADQKKAQTEGERNWVSSVRDITFQVEDIIDEFVYHMNKQKSTGGTFMRSLCQKLYFLKNIWVRRRMALSLHKINNMIKVIPERNQRYRVDYVGGSRSHVDIGHQVPNRGESSLFFKDDDLVGIEDGKQQLLGWLMDEKLQRTVISVVGMGGSGKTALVARAYNSETVKQHFDCFAWITVSKAYQVEDLLRSMIKEFHKAREEAVLMDLSTMSYKELMETIVSYLQSKRYVIVIDDVWSSNFWRDIYVSLPDEGLGSRVMLTTQMEDIASSSFGVKSYVYYVQPLGVRDAWELFCMKTFSGNRNRCCPPELKSLAHDLVAKCGGLPLAIVALGGVMSSKYLESDWRRVCNSLSWELSNNPGLEVVKTILLLSFNDLPYRIKPCFLYCCLFPEDYSIAQKRLIRIWMAEGFVEKVRGITPEEVAESYLLQLISRGMLLVVERDKEGWVEKCKMHDLMRELALSISETDNFCAIYDDYQESSGSEDSGILRRLSVHTIGRDVIQSPKGMSHLRSLLVFAVNDRISPSLKSLSRDLQLLKVLDLEYIPVENLPDGLVDLFNLRYLNLRGTKVSELPHSIGRLCYLETLDIAHSNVQVLPAGITKLQNLRHLILGRDVFNIGSLCDFEITFGARGPDNIWKLKNLQVLYYIEAGGPNMMKQLKSLTQLKTFGITKVRAADEEDLCLSIQNMSLLRVLSVIAADEEECLRMDALFSAPALPHLKKLFLGGKLEKLPHWFPSLESLTCLWLHWSRLTEDPLPHLQALPNLGDLTLSNACPGRTLLCFSTGFHKLRELRLVNLPDLNEIVIEKGVMPGLQRLRIYWCKQLKMLPNGIMHLTNLQELDLFNTSEGLIHSLRAQGSRKDGPMLRQHITRINHWWTSSDGVLRCEKLLSAFTDVSQIKFPSLHTAPGKGLTRSRSIGSLRAEFCKHMEANTNDIVNTGSPPLINEDEKLKKKQTGKGPPDPPHAFPSPSHAISASPHPFPVKMKHDNSHVPHTGDSNLHCPVQAINQSVNSPKSTSLVSIPVTCQLPHTKPLSNIHSTHLTGSTSSCPPEPVNFKHPNQPRFPPTPSEHKPNQFNPHSNQPSNHLSPPNDQNDFPPLTKVGTSPLETSNLPASHELNWTQLFNSNRVKANGTKLQFIPNRSTSIDPNSPVSITPEEVSDQLTRWDNALVGHVIGAKPPYKLMKQFVERRWKAFGSIEVYIIKAGLFIFKFQDEDMKLKVMELGPWSYFDKPLILRPWSPNEVYDRAQPDSLPVWVRFPHLKLHLWSALSLSKIASMIGQPLFTDRMTSQMQRLAYARVCIEVTNKSTFPAFVEIEDFNGKIYKQPVEYEWLPTKCEGCKQFGHRVNQCPREIKQQWKPITKINQSTNVMLPQEAKQPENKPTSTAVKEQIISNVTTINPLEAEAEISISSQNSAMQERNPPEGANCKLVDEENQVCPDSLGNDSPLIISPLAIQEPSPTHDAFKRLLQIESKLECRAKEIKPLIDKDDSIEAKAEHKWELQLSKNQKKKKDKMTHALLVKNKAHHAKPSSPSPSK